VNGCPLAGGVVRVGDVVEVTEWYVEGEEGA
jgi:hypothetical protein